MIRNKFKFQQNPSTIIEICCWTNNDDFTFAQLCSIVDNQYDDHFAESKIFHVEYINAISIAISRNLLVSFKLSDQANPQPKLRQATPFLCYCKDSRT